MIKFSLIFFLEKVTMSHNHLLSKSQLKHQHTHTKKKHSENKKQFLEKNISSLWSLKTLATVYVSNTFQ